MNTRRDLVRDMEWEIERKENNEEQTNEEKSDKNK